jgi:hypothetical protein
MLHRHASKHIHPLLEVVYQELRELAQAGKRMPEKDNLVATVMAREGYTRWPAQQIGCQRSQVYRKMVELGWVRIEIYKENFRVIVLLRENRDGSVHTQAPSGRPYRVLRRGADGHVVDSVPRKSRLSQAQITLKGPPPWLQE